jgi:hypothetical protein
LDAHGQTPDPRNAVGDFYVKRDCCLFCGVPWDAALDLFGYDDNGCWVARQPGSPAEEAKILGCIRYRGGQIGILRALEEIGEKRQHDHPISLLSRFVSWLRKPRQ